MMIRRLYWAGATALILFAVYMILAVTWALVTA